MQEFSTHLPGFIIIFIIYNISCINRDASIFRFARKAPNIFGGHGENFGGRCPSSLLAKAENADNFAHNSDKGANEDDYEP